jgi:hypothetical protein
MMLITGRIGRTAAVVAATLGLTLSAVAPASFAASALCGSTCVDFPGHSPGSGGGLQLTGSAYSDSLLTHLVGGHLARA